jgi:hypothetical protein
MKLGLYFLVLTYLMYEATEFFGGLLSIIFVAPLFVASLLYIVYISIQAIYYSFTESPNDKYLRILAVITGLYIVIGLVTLLSKISILHGSTMEMISYLYSGICFLLIFLSVRFGGENVNQE